MDGFRIWCCSSRLVELTKMIKSKLNEMLIKRQFNKVMELTDNNPNLKEYAAKANQESSLKTDKMQLLKEREIIEHKFTTNLSEQEYLYLFQKLVLVILPQLDDWEYAFSMIEYSEGHPIRNLKKILRMCGYLIIILGYFS